MNWINKNEDGTVKLETLCLNEVLSLRAHFSNLMYDGVATNGQKEKSFREVQRIDDFLLGLDS